MPKVTKDDLLLKKVKAFVARQRSYESAAAQLDVTTSTLWRFVKKGTAIPRTRVALERGVEKLGLASGTASVTPVFARQVDAAMFGNDLTEMRALCSRMMAWIDMAEAAMAKASVVSRPKQDKQRGSKTSRSPSRGSQRP